MEGIVIKNTGSWYIVRLKDTGEDIPCKVKGNFRIKGIRTTNPVAVGDVVNILPNNDGTAFITTIQARRNYIIRRSSNLSKESHIIAANLDYALLITSIKDPLTSTTFIDRFLATSEAYSVPTVIVVNKCDTFDNEDIDYAKAIKHLYETIGYKVILASALEGTGLDEIRTLLPGHTTLLSGNSGVGKSSLINALLPGLNLRTASVSTTHHTGMHTTTFSEMYQLPSGGYIIDTPGIKGFGTIDFKVSEVAHYFKEIFRESTKCKYNNCTHTHEPKCAVRQAVEECRISQSRYASYLNILESDNDEKYRKPF